MSLGDTLSGAIDYAKNAVVASVEGIPQSVVSGISIAVKTNLGPSFTLGGKNVNPADVASGTQPPSPPGILDLLGIKFSATAIDAGGATLFTYGDPPATSVPLVLLYTGLAAGAVFLMWRGVRSLI